MATFNTIEELIQILDENPNWLEALRARLLTRELLELPQRHAEFVAATDMRFTELRSDVNDLSQKSAESAAISDRRHGEFIEFVELSERRHDEFIGFVELSDRRHNEFIEFVELSERRHDEFIGFVELSDRRHNEIRNDIGMLKGGHTITTTLKLADDIAIEMGLRRVDNLNANQLMDMADSADTTGMFDNAQSRKDNLRSFRRADLIMEARDPNGECCYIAVESSYTVNGRDTRRAIRNADYIERFTQKKAHAVVSGIRLDNRDRELVESGKVFWYQIEEHSIRGD